MNNRISPSSLGDAGNDPHNDWNQENRGVYGQWVTWNTGHTGFSNEYLAPRNIVTCFRCGEQGHICTACKTPGVYCTHCRTLNHSTKACRRYGNNNNGSPNSNNSPGHHPQHNQQWMDCSHPPQQAQPYRHQSQSTHSIRTQLTWSKLWHKQYTRWAAPHRWVTLGWGLCQRMSLPPGQLPWKFGGDRSTP